MIKKKATSKTAKNKAAKGKSAKKGKPELNLKEVRKELARMVGSEATTMTQAVIDEGKKGQLATVKYLFEMAEIYPESTDGSQATTNEDSLAKTLLRRMNLPEEPILRDDEEDDVKPAIPEKTVAASDEDQGKAGGRRQEFSAGVSARGIDASQPLLAQRTREKWGTRRRGTDEVSVVVGTITVE